MSASLNEQHTVPHTQYHRVRRRHRHLEEHLKVSQNLFWETASSDIMIWPTEGVHADEKFDAEAMSFDHPCIE
jgi:hypothetical protein